MERDWSKVITCGFDDVGRSQAVEAVQNSPPPGAWTHRTKRLDNHRYAWALTRAAMRTMPPGLAYPKLLPLWELDQMGPNHLMAR